MRNPFNPGAGSRPPLLVGRDEQLTAMTVTVQRMAIGRFERLLTGLRGVGKTVLLNEFGRIAEEAGWVHSHFEATDDVRAARAIATLTRRILLELSLKERSRDRARRALGSSAASSRCTCPRGMWEARSSTSRLAPATQIGRGRH